jgi:uncharacterized protein YprB with RNaseH-like and TPR domain
MINPNTLNKMQQILWYTGHCKHGHAYSTHPACFQRDVLDGVGKEGYWDIETTGFESDYHHMLSWVIKEKDKNVFHTACITKEDLDAGIFDKRICQELVDTLKQFGIIYTYNGTNFDVRFARSRCMFWGIEFPEFGVIQHKDIYFMTKRLLKLHRHSLEAATRFLGIQGKNHVLGKEWMLARIGDAKALEYVLRHNKLDCAILEKLHKRLLNYAKNTTSSM